eukprot:CAMPEP_0181024068 /NCGR_PEP_ID=MMETSP1070-20121207/2376_1 /TAXON_ID=265543 /ORGANISM="Minutocellus polymorphus, Strain NH13" /LENGTH=206 /DNA_ID=CAMNT_0023101103 /DNA_START=124 /DNA_END=744 /DNA_ORIENTATION=+
MSPDERNGHLDIENYGCQSANQPTTHGDDWSESENKGTAGGNSMEVATQDESAKNGKQQALWPKTANEYMFLGLDLAAAGMFPLGAMPCPSIPSATIFIYVFAAFTMLAGIVNFVFSTKRKTAKTDRPKAFVVSQFLGIGHLGLGIWCMALAYPNLGLLSEASPQTCEKGPLVCMIIIAAIFSAVIVGLIGYGLYAVTCRRNSPKD